MVQHYYTRHHVESGRVDIVLGEFLTHRHAIELLKSWNTNKWQYTFVPKPQGFGNFEYVDHSENFTNLA